MAIKEDLKNAFDSYSKYFAIGLSLVIIIVGGYFMLWPQYQQLKQNGVLQYNDTLSQKSERETYLQELEAMKQAEEELTFRAWQNLDYILPQNEEVYLLFAQMEVLAKDNGLVLTSVNISEAAETATPDITAAIVEPTTTLPAEIKTVSLNVNLTGGEAGQDFTYERFKSFLDSLENNIRLIDITSVSYTPEKTMYSFTFTTYYYSDDAVSLETNTAVNSEVTEEELALPQ
ncbi:MAG: hypothetical protein WC752_03995 [Patescibacteria group bacterium]|jgi:hypothetical protein